MSEYNINVFSEEPIKDIYTSLASSLYYITIGVPRMQVCI